VDGFEMTEVQQTTPFGLELGIIQQWNTGRSDQKVFLKLPVRFQGRR
jgi:hypothetical protein